VAVLAGGRSQRPGEGSGLDVGNPHLAILGPPGGLISVDAQPQQAGMELIPRAGALGRRPLRQVMRDPPAWIQRRGGEVLTELQLIAGLVERPRLGRTLRVNRVSHAPIMSR
jgi:hypothetical protein